MFPGQPAEPVHSRRRTRLDRVAVQVALDVAGESVGRFVSPRCGPSRAPSSRSSRARLARAWPASRARCWRRAEIAASVSLESRKPRARLGRLFLADLAQDLGVGGLAHFGTAERSRAGEQLVEQHAQRVDIAARVDVEGSRARPARGSCIRACRSPRRYCVNMVLSVSRWSIALATPKSITLGTGLPSAA